MGETNMPSPGFGEGDPRTRMVPRDVVDRLLAAHEQLRTEIEALLGERDRLREALQIIALWQASYPANVNVGGTVIVKSLKEWHALVKPPTPAEPAAPAGELDVLRKAADDEWTDAPAQVRYTRALEQRVAALERKYLLMRDSLRAPIRDVLETLRKDLEGE